MAFCVKCGNELREGARFCDSCGTETVISSGDNKKIKYDGIIKKCPNCGEILNSFVAECPACGYELRGIDNSDAIKEFADKLDYAKTIQEKASIIRSYPIPNTKEDIFEFLILASSNIGVGVEDEIINAWETKIDQVIKKARIVIKNQFDSKQLEEIYSQVTEKLNKQRKRDKAKKTGEKLSSLVPAFPGAIIVMGWLLSVVILIPLCWIDLDHYGRNNYQVLFFFDMIAGAIILPFIFKKAGILAKLLASFGIISTIILMIPLCDESRNPVIADDFEMLLFFVIVASVIIFVGMLLSKSKAEYDQKSTFGLSFKISVICTAVLLVVYGITYVLNPKPTEQAQKYMESESSSDDYKDDVEKIVWSDLVLGENLPDFGYDEAEVVWDTDDVLVLYFYDMNNEKYKSYIAECKEFGYTIDQENSGANYFAYNDDGYRLHLQYLDFNDNQLTIDLEDPIKKNSIVWPSSKLVKDVPIPEKLIGEVKAERDDAYSVYLTDIEPEYYKEYVSKCQKKGFDIDYTKSDTYFRAENKKGIQLTVEYKGFKILHISVNDYN